MAVLKNWKEILLSDYMNTLLFEWTWTFEWTWMVIFHILQSNSTARDCAPKMCENLLPLPTSTRLTGETLTAIQLTVTRGGVLVRGGGGPNENFTPALEGASLKPSKSGRHWLPNGERFWFKFRFKSLYTEITKKKKKRKEKEKKKKKKRISLQTMRESNNPSDYLALKYHRHQIGFKNRDSINYSHSL